MNLLNIKSYNYKHRNIWSLSYDCCVFVDFVKNETKIFLLNELSGIENQCLLCI